MIGHHKKKSRRHLHAFWGHWTVLRKREAAVGARDTGGIIDVQRVKTMAVQGATKSVRMLYRDCLRVCKHMGGESPKAMAMRAMVQAEFRKNMHETDEEKIADMKFAAVRGLANYLVVVSEKSIPKENLPKYDEADFKEKKEDSK